MKRFDRFVFGAALAGCAGLTAVPAHAFDQPEDAVRYRRAAFTLLGEHMGRVHDQLKANPVNVDQLQKDLRMLSSVAEAPWGAFAADTQKVKSTSALPRIWTDNPRFRKLSDDMVAEIRKLSTTGADPAALRAQFNAAGRTCKACHDDYKAK